MKNNYVHKTSSLQLNHPHRQLNNPLGISRVNSIWDNQRKHLILLVECRQMFGKEVSPIVKDTKLILESTLEPSWDKPMRTHLIEREIRDEFENGTLDIGFSEVKLKPGYQYSIVSFQVIDSSLIKVILRYRSEGKTWIH